MQAIRITMVTMILMVIIVGSGRGQAPSPGAGPGKSASGDRFISVNEYRFHYRDQGVGAPTVVMEAGLCQPLNTWDDISNKVAGFARVLIYDRVGLGGSFRISTPGDGQASPRPGSRTSGQMVEELRALLRKAGAPAPYVLVGHSFGGLNVRLFASKYPREVAGLVLIDSSNEEEYARYAALMPGSQRAGYERLNRGANCECVNLEASAAQIREAPPLPHAPMIVLSAVGGPRPESVITHFELQADLARRAPNSVHLIAERSGHFIQHDRPDVVIEAIRKVVEEARPFRVPLPTEEDLKQVRFLRVATSNEAYVSGVGLALSWLVGWRWRRRKRQSGAMRPNRAERRQALREETRKALGRKTNRRFRSELE